MAIALGPTPAGKISDLNEIYYSDCLQSPIEARENLLDDGLGIKESGVEAILDINVLIRMDSTSQMARLKEGVGAAILTPNEAREEVGLLPIAGGDTVYMQQQNYSLAALAKRDQKDDPFSTGASSKPPELPSKNDAEKAFLDIYRGVFDLRKQYKKGEMVARNGSLWYCKSDYQGEFNH